MVKVFPLPCLLLAALSEFPKAFGIGIDLSAGAACRGREIRHHLKLDLHDRATGPVVITPHFRELARVLDVHKDEIAGDPAKWARTAADDLGVTVLLKGHTTYVAGPGISLAAPSAPAP